MADIIKDLRTQHPDMSIPDILDLAREKMMNERIEKVGGLEIVGLVDRLRKWDLTETEVVTLLANTPFSPIDLLMFLMREKPKPQRRSWLSCLGSSNT
jgi:hypothetical protein